MVMVLPLVELKHRLARLEMVSRKKPRLLKLHEHSVDRGQTNVSTLGKQNFVDVFRGEVTLRRTLKNFQNFDARHGRFQAAALELFYLVRVVGGHGFDLGNVGTGRTGYR